MVGQQGVPLIVIEVEPIGEAPCGAMFQHAQRLGLPHVLDPP